MVCSMTKANDVCSLMPKVIRTADLLLRPIQSNDLDAYFALYSDPDVMRGWGTHPHKDREETRALIEYLQDQGQKGDMVRWAITDKNDPSLLLGDVGFWRFVKVRHRGEVGAKLAKSCWKKGWMTQALSAVIEYGFAELGLHSVEGNVDPNNSKSQGLVDKIGFTKVGLVPEHSFDPFENKFQDSLLYSITKTGWKGYPCEILPHLP